jgi:hypothetical protein
MKIIYIAHPISGDISGNLEKIRLIVRELNLTRTDIVPFAPYWLDCHALDDNDTVHRKRGIMNSKALLARCDEVWLYGPALSRGMTDEIVLALSLKIPVRAMSKELIENEEINFCLENFEKV